jgi:hypothetical protein
MGSDLIIAAGWNGQKIFPGRAIPGFDRPGPGTRQEHGADHRKMPHLFDSWSLGVDGE